MTVKGESNRKQAKFKLLDNVWYTHPTQGRTRATIVSTLDGKGDYLVTGYGPRINEVKNQISK